MPNDDIFPFDYLDEFEVMNRFTIPELRKEIHAAEIHLFLYENTRDYPAFPYKSWLHLCRECLSHLRQKPAQNTPTAASAHTVDVPALKTKIDIADIASRYTELKKSGNNRLSGRCPVHQEKTPSFMVYPDKQNWHCFGCNKGGDVIALVMAAENMDFKSAVAKLQ